MYDMKALYEAHSVEEAVALRLEHPEAQIIAGGSDVLVQMRRNLPRCFAPGEIKAFFTC